jgi:pimeloyl-ACP methyl ester carboxylesterase
MRDLRVGDGPDIARRAKWLFGIVCTVALPASLVAQQRNTARIITWQPDSLPGVERGSLQVPAVRARPAAGRITLSLLRFQSTAARPGAPIVYLAGGPGGSGIDEMRQAPAQWIDSLRALGDLIALDQRGSGASEPRNLRCDGGPALPLDQPGERDLYARAFRERVRRCASLMQERGVALDALTTAENADDLETLRRALGSEQIRLLGGSYGRQTPCVHPCRGTGLSVTWVGPPRFATVVPVACGSGDPP